VQIHAITRRKEITAYLGSLSKGEWAREGIHFTIHLFAGASISRD